MCGIWALIEKSNIKSDISKYLADFWQLKHRGPDNSHFETFNQVYVGFHRLAIMDPTFHANQPYTIEDGERTIIFICNGEIYNFRELIKDHELVIPNNSDCMTIPKLYIKYSRHNPNGHTDIEEFTNLFKNDIKGEFAFVLFEFDRLQNLKQIVAGRDQIGIRPLYYHKPSCYSQALMFSSEIKGMVNFEDTIQEFQPGLIFEIDFDDFGKICLCKKYNFKIVYDVVPFTERKGDSLYEKYFLTDVRNSVINSVKRRLLADRPIAFLLSDATLIKSILKSIILSILLIISFIFLVLYLLHFSCLPLYNIS